MRALLSFEPGDAGTLIMGSIDAPVARDDEIVIKVKACGVNFPDGLIIEDRYQYKPSRPFAPGAEVAGTVVAVGANVDRFAIGDRVMAMCGWGGMAEQVAVPARECHKMPAQMPYEEGAAFLMTFGTAYYALKQRGQVKVGEKLLVLGASGGVGLAAVALGAALGAEVIAATSDQAKLDLALANGATSGFVYPAAGAAEADQKALNALVKSRCGPVDVVLDPVGGWLSEASVRALAWNGRYLIIGFPAGISRLPLNLLLLKGASAIGVFYGTFTEIEQDLNYANNCELVQLYETGKIRPIVSKRFPLAQGGDAIRELVARRAVGKIVVDVPGDEQ